MYSLFFIVVTCLILPFSCIAVNIKLVQFIDSNASVAISKALNDGLKVAVNAANSSDSSFYPNTAEIVIKDTKDINKLLDELKDLAKDPKLIAVYGLVGEKALNYTLPILNQTGLTLFNPIVGRSRSFSWSPYVVYTYVNVALEILAILTELIIHKQLRRVSYMYSSGYEWEPRSGAITIPTLKLFNLTLNSFFVEKKSMSDEEFEKAWDVFVSTDPQAVIVFGSPGNSTTKFLQYCLERMVYKPFVVVVSSLLVDSVDEIYKKRNRNIDYTNVTLLVVTASPTVSDTRFNAIERFREEYRNTNDTHYSLDELYENEGQSSLTISAWLGAKVLLNVINQLNGNISRQKLRNKTFETQMISIDDIDYGMYADNCSGVFPDVKSKSAYYTDTEASCHSNQGGHSLQIYKVSMYDGNYTPINKYQTDVEVIDNTGIKIQDSIVIYQPIIKKKFLSLFMFLKYEVDVNQFFKQISVYMSHSELQLNDVDPFMSPSHQELYGLQLNHYISTTLAGFVQLPVDPRIIIPVISPISRGPRMYQIYVFPPYLIHLMAMLEQVLFTI